MSRHFPACLTLIACLLLSGVTFADTSSASAALNEGRADDAARLLQAQLAGDPHNAGAHLLLCRVFYSTEMADSAITECEAAVANAATSENYLWLGRAYGMKASRANLVSAFRLARKVVASFQQAVQADPHNAAALSDLGQYYVAAPAIVGGGIDKAQELTTRLMPVSATKAHRILAMLAEKQNDKVTAEAEFKKAVEAHRSPATLVDLADFYQRQERADEAVASVQAAIRLDRQHDAAMVDAASILTSLHRMPQLAEQLLQQYLASPAKTDDAPAAKVHVQLGRLMRMNGDPDGARREYQAALALVSDYAPAQRGLKRMDAKVDAVP